MTDKIDAAVAAALAPKPELRMNIVITLGNGRQCQLGIPIPMSAEEVIELLVSLPNFIGQANVQATRGHGITLPNGQVVPVMPATETPKES